MGKFGKTVRGTQRWRCSKCGITATSRNESNHYHRQFHWFKKWMVEGLTVKQLANEGGHSQWMIRDTIRYWLERPPASRQLATGGACMMDGTYLNRSTGILTMLDIKRGVLGGLYGVTEKPCDLQRFLGALQQSNVSPSSITIDGNVHVIRALRAQWPTAIIQRCLVHVQRQGLMWCRRFPKRLDARKLRALFLVVTYIETPEERDRWVTQLVSWEARYGTRIAASRETGWVFSDLKRARSMVLKALPDMFHYLDFPEIPRTTNALEGYFGRLKDRYHDHRGLARKSRAAYFQWYFRLCP